MSKSRSGSETVQSTMVHENLNVETEYLLTGNCSKNPQAKKKTSVEEVETDRAQGPSSRVARTQVWNFQKIQSCRKALGDAAGTGRARRVLEVLDVEQGERKSVRTI